MTKRPACRCCPRGGSPCGACSSFYRPPRHVLWREAAAVVLVTAAAAVVAYLLLIR